MSDTHAALKVIRILDVCNIVGLKRSGVYRLVQIGTFPRPVKLSIKATGWIESEVYAWLNARIAVRDTRLTQQGVA